ncbi:hypothetical protein ACNKHT_17140 [Shigella flexneri]
MTEDYAEDIWRSLERDVFPAIGDVSVTVLKLIDWFRPSTGSGQEHWNRFVACANVLMRS